MNSTSRAPAIDMGLLWAMLALLGIGLLTIYSASHITDGASKVIKQGIFAAGGLGALLVVMNVDYRVWARHRVLLYVITVLALLITLFIARKTNGANSWIDLGPIRLQPSEFAKIALTLALGAVLARYAGAINEIKAFARVILLCFVPVFLVLAQPDFGTAMILCSICFVLLLLGETHGLLLFGLCATVLLVIIAAWNIRLPGGRPLVSDIQKRRLDFLHADPTGSGYHQRQAAIAIGSGELWGKGYLHGTQAQRGFLPEQDTDFIFAVIGEEFGLFGALVVLALYLFIIWRLLLIVGEAETSYGRLVAGGIAAMFAAHVVINIGMCLTLTPVTGVPLPFVSYGGSNLLTSMFAMGVALNISRHRRDLRTWAVAEQPLLKL